MNKNREYDNMYYMRLVRHIGTLLLTFEGKVHKLVNLKILSNLKIVDTN